MREVERNRGQIRKAAGSQHKALDRRHKAVTLNEMESEWTVLGKGMVSADSDFLKNASGCFVEGGELGQRQGGQLGYHILPVARPRGSTQGSGKWSDCGWTYF